MQYKARQRYILDIQYISDVNALLSQSYMYMPYPFSSYEIGCLSLSHFDPPI